ncbi:hypothetical protein AURANDRAFT_29896, partial [Aureococcus anophagefferens]
LGDAYHDGWLGLVKSDKKAAKIWKRAVELGNVYAMRNLGTLYRDGSGVKLDKKKAERLYRTAADRGIALAQYNTGLLLYSEQRFEEAFRYYALAADQGYRRAENNLGICHERGNGTEVDLGKARYCNAEELARLRRHVENEVPEAISCLGDAYHDGWLGLVKSDKKAAKIWKRAVELGNVYAMRNLGTLYRDGSGVKLDKKKAERLYRMAADRGIAVAQTSIGLFLESEKRHEEAFRYFALAADQGHIGAEFCLGCSYMDGDGTEVDLGMARYWFERAAAKGSEEATEGLAHLDARV